MPKVSVMMPAYNVEKYVGEAIESILNQTFQDFELVVVDDGSTDATYQVIANYAKQNAKIRLLRNEENKGLVFTRNRLLDEAKGDYLAILDSDDIALPDRLEKQVNYLDNNLDIGLLGGNVTLFDATNEALNDIKMPTNPKLLACRMLFQNAFGQSTMMFRKEFAVLHYRLPLAEDYDLWVRMSWQTNIANLDDILIRYRLHENNISVLKQKALEKNVEQIHYLQLERLGLTPTQQDLEIHYIVATFQPIVDKAIFKRGLDWITRLKKANQIQKLYPIQEFRQELVFRLHEFCSNSLALGNDIASWIRTEPITCELFTFKQRYTYWLLAKAKAKDASLGFKLVYGFYKKWV